MKLYVIELLKRNGGPYKKARHLHLMKSEAIAFETREEAEEWRRCANQQNRIRTLALLPMEES